MTEAQDAITNATAKPAAHGNGFNPKKVKGYVGRVENLEDQIASLRGKFMAECKGFREDIKSVLDEAKDDGIAKKALKRVLQTRNHERKIEDLREELEPDEQDTYDMLRHALGDLADTALGAAAAERAGFKDQLKANNDAGDAHIKQVSAGQQRKNEAVDSLTS